MLMMPLKRWTGSVLSTKSNNNWQNYCLNVCFFPWCYDRQALAEEKTVYNRSMNKLKYLSVAVNALKKLKNQNAVTAKGD